TQASHAHTQPTHTHSYSAPHSEATAGYYGSGGYYPVKGRTTGASGGENTGSAQPTITINTTNVTTSSSTPSISVGNTGSGTSFDIMPPYYTVCIWKRLS
ncbi:MAG: hypothetical protein ACRCZO_20455, partial [Cetobacterium sp.]